MIQMNHTHLPAFEDVQKNKPPFKGEGEAPFCQLTGVRHFSEVKRGQNNNLKFDLWKFMTWQISEVFYWLFNKTVVIMQIKLRGTVHSPQFPPLQKSQVFPASFPTVTPSNQVPLTVPVHLGSKFWDFVTGHSFKESLHPPPHTHSQEIKHVKAQNNVDSTNNPCTYSITA